MTERRRFAAPLFGTIRFVVAGVVATATNILVLYALTRRGVWYVPASVMAFLSAFVVSFFLQKYWTFGDRSRVLLASQAARFFLILLFNTVVNTLLVYAIVEYDKFTPVVAQAVASLVIAFESFFAYRWFVFKPQPVQ